MASSLRRTLHRSVLYSAICISLLACNNSSSNKKKEIMHEFDSIDQKLKALNDEIGESTSALYDSVAAKYGEMFLQQFNYTVNDCKGYLSDLKFRFLISCGSTDSISIPASNETKTELTKQFFLNEGHAETLYHQLAGVQRTLSSHNDDPLLDEEINAMTGITDKEGPKKFGTKYFSNVPPIAAMTILSKFENDINALEKKVLQQILKAPSQ